MATEEELKQAIRDIDSWIYGTEGIGIIYCYGCSAEYDKADLRSFEIVKQILGENNGNNE